MRSERNGRTIRQRRINSVDAVDRKQEVLEAMKGAPLDGGSGSRGKGLKRAQNRSGGNTDQSTKTVIRPIKDTRQHPDPAVAQTVANMVFAGMSQETIARVLKMGLDTLHKYYKHEVEHGQVAMVSNIAGSLAQRALSGSDTAAIFLLKTRGKGQFSERTQLELTGKDGGPIQIEHAMVLDRIASALEKGITIDHEPDSAQKKGTHEGAE
jgi:hypothetical protein